MWRRDVVMRHGAFSAETMTEDTDLTLTLIRSGHRIRYMDRAVGHTCAPSTLGALYRQRLRWLFGNLQCAHKHLGGFRDGPRALRVFGLPNFLFAHLFVFALAPLSLVYLPRALTVFAPTEIVCIGLALLSLDVGMAAIAYVLDRERKVELLAAPVQRVCFPFLLWAVFASVVWRLIGEGK